MCTLTVARYEPQNKVADQRVQDSTGPIIIGQEDTGLDRSFNGLSVSNHRGTMGTDPARHASYYNTTPVPRSFTYRKGGVGQHTPRPLNSFGQALGSPVSLHSPAWSPCSNPYASYGVQSPIWSPYSPGTIGQERGSPMLPQGRQDRHRQQHRTAARAGGRQNADFSSGHHNVVDTNRIRRGEDVRTTVGDPSLPNPQVC